MRLTRVAAALAVSAMIATLAVLLTVGEAVSFSQSNYYIFPLGGTSVDLESLVQTAQAQGYAVIRYDGSSVLAYQGAELATAPIETLLAGDRLLIVDGSRFLLRASGESSTYAVRPSSDGLELVFSPHEDQGLDGVLSALVDLEGLGVISSEVDFGFRAFARESLKGPVPPTGARTDSDLYWLTVAEDWHAFAAVKGLSLVGLRVDVVVEFLPGSALPAEYAEYVSSESASLAELLLPIDLLVELASSEGVGFVRQPYEPVIP